MDGGLWRLAAAGVGHWGGTGLFAFMHCQCWSLERKSLGRGKVLAVWWKPTASATSKRLSVTSKPERIPS